MPKMLEYNDDRHEYRWNGKIVLSVTQIIPDQKFYQTAEKLEAARLEGNNNHSLVKMYFDTRCTFGDPYLERFEKWYLENKKMLGELRAYEEMFYSKFGFPGRPDLIFKNAVVDLKRSLGNLKHHALQLAGYSILAKEHKLTNTKKWLIIWDDGKEFKMKNCYDNKSEGMFRSLLLKHKNLLVNEQIDQQYKNYMGAI